MLNHTNHDPDGFLIRKRSKLISMETIDERFGVDLPKSEVTFLSFSLGRKRAGTSYTKLVSL